MISKKITEEGETGMNNQSKLKELKIYIINRLNDIDNSLNDELISEKEIAYLLGQKDELQTIKRLMGW